MTFHIAQLYDEGDQVEKLHHIAFLFYEKAAKLQDPDALYELGNRFLNGKGIKTDTALAIHYYTEAARISVSHCAPEFVVRFAPVQRTLDVATQRHRIDVGQQVRTAIDIVQLPECFHLNPRNSVNHPSN